MDIKHRYIKPPDFKEFRAEDGRLIRVFTLSKHPIWMTCIYDEERDIAWKTAHMDYEAAYNDFVTFCKLLECETEIASEEAAQSMEIPKPMRRRGSDYLQWAVIAIIVYMVLKIGGGL